MVAMIAVQSGTPLRALKVLLKRGVLRQAPKGGLKKRSYRPQRRGPPRIISGDQEGAHVLVIIRYRDIVYVRCECRPIREKHAARDS